MIETLMAVHQLEAEGVEVGGNVYLQLDELQLFGWAHVLAVLDCPPLRKGPGRLVTSRITTTRRGDLVEVRLGHADNEPITCTAGHPFWSATRSEWVLAGHLLPGEHLQTSEGTTLSVQSIRPVDGTATVYNIEVDGAHQYFAGREGVLVHNASAWVRAAKFLGKGNKRFAGRVAKFTQHKKGNVQVTLKNGQSWHLPNAAAAKRVPKSDPIGDRLQLEVTKVAARWNAEKLSPPEVDAINLKHQQGLHYVAKILERQARGRWVEKEVRDAMRNAGFGLRFNSVGVDVVDPMTGLRYEILSGTESNRALHAKRMAGDFYRMITF